MSKGIARSPKVMQIAGNPLLDPSGAAVIKRRACCGDQATPNDDLTAPNSLLGYLLETAGFRVQDPGCRAMERADAPSTTHPQRVEVSVCDLFEQSTKSTLGNGTSHSPGKLRQFSWQSPPLKFVSCRLSILNFFILVCLPTPRIMCCRHG
jgi:hypothetical protein